MTTAVMTRHARERCIEMGISTKVAKHIVANAEIRFSCRCSKDGNKAMMAKWTGQPDYAVVHIEDDGVPVVLTVVFETTEPHIRAGTTYRLEREAS